MRSVNEASHSCGLNLPTKTIRYSENIISLMVIKYGIFMKYKVKISYEYDKKYDLSQIYDIFISGIVKKERTTPF